MRPHRHTIASEPDEALRPIKLLLARYQLAGWPKDTTEIEALTEQLTHGESR